MGGFPWDWIVEAGRRVRCSVIDTYGEQHQKNSMSVGVIVSHNFVLFVCNLIVV